MKLILFVFTLISLASCAMFAPAPKGEELYLRGESVQTLADGKTENFRLATLIKRIDVNKGEAYHEWLYLAPDASGKMQAYDSVATRIGKTNVYVITQKDNAFIGRLTYSDDSHDKWTAELHAKAGHTIYVKGQRKENITTEEKKIIKFTGEHWFTIKTQFAPTDAKDFEAKLKEFKKTKG